jgi:hypothetical protein
LHFRDRDYKGVGQAFFVSIHTHDTAYDVGEGIDLPTLDLKPWPPKPTGIFTESTVTIRGSSALNFALDFATFSKSFQTASADK